MKKIIVLLVAAFALIAVGSPAVASGSDAPVPYTLDVQGVTLPGSDVFKANGHVNIKYLSKGSTKSAGIHFDPNNNQPGGKWIGRNFIPWTAFAKDIECITWVQIDGYNQHYGEGGQKPLCITKPPTAPPSDSEDREVITGVNCEERIVEWRKDRREAVYDYDYTKGKWVQTGWTEWKKIDSGFHNKKDASCEDLPTVGTSVSPVLLTIGIAALLGGLFILFFRRRKS